MTDENPEYDSRLADKFVVRLLPGQRPALHERARLNGRSMNTEVQRFIQAGLGEPLEPQHGVWTPTIGMAVEVEQVSGERWRGKITELFYDSAEVAQFSLGTPKVYVDYNDMKPFELEY